MRQPAATFRDGAIYWRGSDATFSYMFPVTARALLALLEERAEQWADIEDGPERLAGMIADLRAAIKLHDDQQENTRAA